MKLALVCPYSLDLPGGIQEHVKALYKIYKEQGHEVRILTAGSSLSSGKKLGDIIQIGRAAPWFSNLANDSTGTVNFFLDTQNQIQQVLEHENFDLIHFHSPIIPFISWQILAESKSVNVATFHIAFVKKCMELAYKLLINTLSPITRSLGKTLDGSIAVSKAAATVAKRLYGIKADVIIPNGVDLKRFNPEVPPIKKYKDGMLNILFVGRLDARKGGFYLLKSFSAIKEKFPRARLIVVGEGELRRGLEEFVEVYGLEDVVFEGYVEGQLLPSYYATANVFCSPATHGESFGIVLLEAMASGVPVVAFDNLGYRQVLKGFGKHCLAPQKNIEALTKKIERLIEDKEFKNELVQWGLREVEKYSWEKVSQEIFAFYKKALVSKGVKALPLRDKILEKIGLIVKEGKTLWRNNVPFSDLIQRTFFNPEDWYKK